MPEGPTLVILKEQILQFEGKKVIEAKGNAKIDFQALENKKILAIRTWGKQLLLSFNNYFVRVHFLMFGSYSINEQTKPDKSLRLCLQFTKGSIYFYTCSVKIIEGDADALYDWPADIMSENWDPRKARKKILAQSGMMICDVLLDQQIFSGCGNIIKNEVLFRVKLHPETLVKDIPSKKLSAVIKEVRNYSFDFLKWKKEYTLKKHWLIYTKKICPRCEIPVVKKYCGKTKRRTFFCTNCQEQYT